MAQQQPVYNQTPFYGQQSSFQPPNAYSPMPNFINHEAPAYPPAEYAPQPAYPPQKLPPQQVYGYGGEASREAPHAGDSPYPPPAGHVSRFFPSVAATDHQQGMSDGFDLESES